MQVKVAELRKLNNLSQQELADLIGVSRKTISTIETGRFTPSVVIASPRGERLNRETPKDSSSWSSRRITVDALTPSICAAPRTEPRAATAVKYR